MVRLKRLKIHRFRHVEPGTELHFGETFNVLLGRNAAGKTTLLELVNAAVNDDFSQFDDERRGFDVEYDLELGSKGRVTYRLQREWVEPEFVDAIGYAGMRIGQGLAREHGHIRWAEDGKEPWECTIVQRTVTYGDGRRFELDNDPSRGVRADVYGAADVKRTRGWYDSDLRAPFLEDAPRFDESDGFLSVIGAPRLYEHDNGGNSDPLFLVASNWPMDLLQSPREILAEDGNSLRWASTKFPILQDIASCLHFDSIEVLANLREKGADKTSFDEPRFLFQSAGLKIVHHLLSFGQRRLLAFLWYLALRKHLPVVADELVNGFHHEWISQCVDRLRSRQSFLATQNPLLLDDLPVTGAEEPPTTFIRCESKQGPTGELMSWRSFAQDEADRVSRAREIGIQSISETLRAEGLW